MWREDDRRTDGGRGGGACRCSRETAPGRPGGPAGGPPGRGAAGGRAGGRTSDGRLGADSRQAGKRSGRSQQAGPPVRPRGRGTELASSGRQLATESNGYGAFHGHRRGGTGWRRPHSLWTLFWLRRRPAGRLRATFRCRLRLKPGPAPAELPGPQTHPARGGSHGAAPGGRRPATRRVRLVPGNGRAGRDGRGRTANTVGTLRPHGPSAEASRRFCGDRRQQTAALGGQRTHLEVHAGPAAEGGPPPGARGPGVRGASGPARLPVPGPPRRQRPMCGLRRCLPTLGAGWVLVLSSADCPTDSVPQAPNVCG